MARRLSIALLPALLALGGCGSEAPRSAAPSPAAERAALRGSPPALAQLHAEQSRIEEGGVDAFRARLAALRGHPVVVNKWASWCAPCRAEFPILQRVSVGYGRRVGFVGLNSGDAVPAARRFLKATPVPYPSYEDPKEKIARAIGAPLGYPITQYYSRTGELIFSHSGGYSTVAALERDVRRYALGS
jgi:thiol-disulfide isomerase/thioredoxin